MFFSKDRGRLFPHSVLKKQRPCLAFLIVLVVLTVQPRSSEKTIPRNLKFVCRGWCFWWPLFFFLCLHSPLVVLLFLQFGTGEGMEESPVVRCTRGCFSNLGSYFSEMQTPSFSLWFPEMCFLPWLLFLVLLNLALDCPIDTLKNLVGTCSLSLCFGI